MIQLLNTLFENGLYEQLYKSGLVSSKLSTYRDIYLYVDAKMKINGMGKESAVLSATVQFECNRRTVYRALKAMS